MITLALSCMLFAQDAPGPPRTAAAAGAELIRLAQTRRAVRFTRQQILELKKTVDLFYVKNSKMPAGWEDLIRRESSGMRYIDAEEPPRDAWGRELVLVQGRYRNRMWILSHGPDGEAGTVDDIDSRTASLTPPGVLEKLRDLDGKPLDMTMTDWRVVVVHFWSGRCPRERRALAELARVAAADPDDVLLVAIASEADEIGDRPLPRTFTVQDPAQRPYALMRAQARRDGLAHVLVDHGGLAARYFADLRPSIAAPAPRTPSSIET